MSTGTDIYRANLRNELDWSEPVPYARGKTRTQLDKSISNTNSREKLLITKTEKIDVPEVQLSKIYQLKNKKWTHIGYQCKECNKVFSGEDIKENHKYTCKRINKNKED